MLHPVVLTAIAVLVVNDHYLKQQHPSWITGKLSDFAGLVFFPLMLTWMIAVVTRWQHAAAAAFALTAVWFTSVKTIPLLARLTERSLETVFGISSRIVVDPTDLVALPALFVGWRIWQRGSSNQPRSRLGVSPRFVVAVAAVATIATSDVEPPRIDTLVAADGGLYASVVESEPDNRLTYLTQDGGATWLAVEPPPGVAFQHAAVDQPLVRCRQTSTNECSAQLIGWAIEASTDGGITWDPSPDVGVPGVYTGRSYVEVSRFGCDQDHCYRQLSQPRISEVSVDSGRTWGSGEPVDDRTLENLSGSYRCEADSSNRCFRRQRDGSTFHETFDGGLTWAPLTDESELQGLWESYSSGDNRQVTDPLCLEAGQCFRIFRPDGATIAHMEESSDSGASWTRSWSPSPRFPSTRAPRPSRLAVDPGTDNLVVSLAADGVVVRDSDGRWTLHSVGGVISAALPAPFPPGSPPLVYSWAATVLVLLMALRMWGQASSREPTAAPRPRPWAPLVASAAVIVALTLVVAGSAQYPYGLAYGPEALRLLVWIVVFIAVPPIAFLALWRWSLRYMPVQRIERIVVTSAVGVFVPSVVLVVLASSG